PEPADVCHDVIRPARPKAAEANFVQDWQKAIAALAVRFRQLLVVACRQTQRGCPSLLQRSGCAYRGWRRARTPVATSVGGDRRGRPTLTRLVELGEGARRCIGC